MTNLKIYKSLSKRFNKSGFTLIELMVALAIVGILASLAVANYLNRLPDIRAKQAARQVWMDFKRAQSTALSRNTDVVVLFNPSEGTYDIVIDTDSDMGETGSPDTSGGDADEFFSRDNALPQSIVFASGLGTVVGVDGEGLGDGVTLSNNRVFFQPSGRASTKNEDTIDNVLNKASRAVYVIPEADISKNNHEKLWAVTINGISGNAEMKEYKNGKWGG